MIKKNTGKKKKRKGALSPAAKDFVNAMDLKQESIDEAVINDALRSMAAKLNTLEGALVWLQTSAKQKGFVFGARGGLFFAQLGDVVILGEGDRPTESLVDLYQRVMIQEALEGTNPK